MSFARPGLNVFRLQSQPLRKALFSFNCHVKYPIKTTVASLPATEAATVTILAKVEPEAPPTSLASAPAERRAELDSNTMEVERDGDKEPEVGSSGATPDAGTAGAAIGGEQRGRTPAKQPGGGGGGGRKGCGSKDGRKGGGGGAVQAASASFVPPELPPGTVIEDAASAPHPEVRTVWRRRCGTTECPHSQPIT